MSLPSGNLVYPLALDGFLKAQINVTSTTIAAYAVDGTYSYLATHEFVADLGSSIKGGPINFAGVAVADGVVTASPMTTLFPAASGGPWAALVIAENTGTPSTDRLLALIVRDADTTPVDVATTGAAITYTWLSQLFYI